MIIFYKEIKRRDEECEHCHKLGTRYKVVRWVEEGKWSFVAGVNIAPAYYCSMSCMREEEGGKQYVRVRENTVKEINGLGYSA